MCVSGEFYQQKVECGGTSPTLLTLGPFQT